MGLMSKAKADSIEGHAERAWAEGRVVFTPVLVSGAGLVSEPVRGWAEMIEAIEAIGWELDQWSVTSVMNGRASMLQAVPLFRRPL